MTHASGKADTRRDMWGGLQPSLRPLAVMFVVASLLHLPLVPTHLSAWFRLLFRNVPAEVEEGPQQDLVLPFDVDLLSDTPEQSSGQDEAGSEAVAEADETEPAQDSDDDLLGDFDDDDEPDAGAPPPPKPPQGEPDAGAVAQPDAGAPPLDAGASDEPDAGPPAPVAEALPRGKLEDPYGGDAQQVHATHPNVNVFIAADMLRKRDLHSQFSELLSSIPQWNALLGGTGIDPLRDFDKLLISGPQFRDPAWIVVVVKYRVSSGQMRKALDVVIKRDKGEAHWEERDVAVIGKDGSRVAMLVPKQKLLWILPLTQKDDLERARRSNPFAKTPKVGMVVDLRTPKNAFATSGFAFPESIDHMRLHFNLAQDGYVVIAEGWDGSPAEATKHAAELEGAIAALDLVDKAPDFLKGFANKLELSVLGDTSFTTDGKKIYAKALVSEKQVARIVRFIKKGIDDRAQRQKEAAEKRKEAKKRLEATKKLIRRRSPPGAKAKPAVHDPGKAAQGGGKAESSSPVGPGSPTKD